MIEVCLCKLAVPRLEIKYELNTQTQSLEEIKEEIRDICVLNLERDQAIYIYNNQGLEIQDDLSLGLINPNSYIYIADDTISFNPKMCLSAYHIHKRIGKGGFGVVFHAIEKLTQKNVALKFIHLALTCIQTSNSFFKELLLLKQLQHKNIIQLKAGFVYQRTAVLVMDFAAGGELKSYLRRHGRFTEREAREIMKQILCAVDYCHSKGIIHRDLKLENILLYTRSTLEIRIVDFGIAGFSNETSPYGSLNYMPPERLSGERKIGSPAFDIWSIGCIFYALLFGRHPFTSKGGKEELLESIKEGANFDMAEGLGVSVEAIDLLKRILNVRYEERITLSGIRVHPWIQCEDVGEIPSNDNICMEEVRESREGIFPKKRGSLGYEVGYVEHLRPYSPQLHRYNPEMDSSLPSSCTSHTAQSTPARHIINLHPAPMLDRVIQLRQPEPQGEGEGEGRDTPNSLSPVNAKTKKLRTKNNNHNNTQNNTHTQTHNHNNIQQFNYFSPINYNNNSQGKKLSPRSPDHYSKYTSMNNASLLPNRRIKTASSLSPIRGSNKRGNSKLHKLNLQKGEIRLPYLEEAKQSKDKKESKEWKDCDLHSHAHTRSVSYERGHNNNNNNNNNNNPWDMGNEEDPYKCVDRQDIIIKVPSIKYRPFIKPSLANFKISYPPPTTNNSNKILPSDKGELKNKQKKIMKILEGKRKDMEMEEKYIRPSSVSPMRGKDKLKSYYNQQIKIKGYN